MVEEVAPAFEKATGIKIDFTLLPVDPWRARLSAELSAGSGGIDVVQWSVGMAGWIARTWWTTGRCWPIKSATDFDWGRFPVRHQEGRHL